MDYGVFWAFCVFNFIVVFVCSWLYLGGLKSIRRRIGGIGSLKKKKSGGGSAQIKAREATVDEKA